MVISPLSAVVLSISGIIGDTLATFLPWIQKEIGISIDSLTHFTVPPSGKSVVNFTEWRNEFLPDDRRRFEPKSQGSILSIERYLLTKYLNEKNLRLYFYGSFSRSVDKFIAESEMNWNKKIIVESYPD